MNSTTQLQDYIAAKGDTACAELWGFTARAVAAWRRGERTPDVESARIIISRTDGLTWDSIYGTVATDSAA
jgi:hypothetical protein